MWDETKNTFQTDLCKIILIRMRLRQCKKGSTDGGSGVPELNTDGQQLSIPVRDTCPTLPRGRAGSTPVSTPTSPWKGTTAESSYQSPILLVKGLCAQSFPCCGGRQKQNSLLSPSNPSFSSSFLNFSSPWKLKQEKGLSCVQAGV